MSRQEFTYNQQRNIWRYVFISMWFSIKVQILQTRWNFVYFIEIFSKELPALIYCSQAGCRPFGTIRSVEQTKCLPMQGAGDKVKCGYQPIKPVKTLWRQIQVEKILDWMWLLTSEIISICETVGKLRGAQGVYRDKQAGWETPESSWSSASCHHLMSPRVLWWRASSAAAGRPYGVEAVWTGCWADSHLLELLMSGRDISLRWWEDKVLSATMTSDCNYWFASRGRSFEGILRPEPQVLWAPTATRSCEDTRRNSSRDTT